jgi:hypothetical protein
MPTHDIFTQWSAMTDVERQAARAFRPTAETKVTLKHRAGKALAQQVADVVPRFAKEWLLDRLMVAYQLAESRGKVALWDVIRSTR